MDIVVADTGPLNYLIEIGAVSVLEHLFGTVIVPETVQHELQAPGAPTAVRAWIHMPPPWTRIERCTSKMRQDDLDPGEAEAIAIALERGLKYILMDDGDGRAAAWRAGLVPMGTLGLLEKADEKKLLQYEVAIAALKLTNFRASSKLFELSAQRVHTHRTKPGP